MKVFVDTNVLLDVVLDRKPHVEYARLLLEAGWKGQFSLFTSSVSLLNMHYIVQANSGKAAGLNAVIHLKEIFSILNVDQKMIDQAVSCDPTDFEDAVQIFSAKSANCDVIITRDRKGFVGFDIEVKTPKEFFKALNG